MTTSSRGFLFPELDSNLTLKDKMLNVRNKKLIEILENGLFEAREINKAFEPRNSEADKDKTEVFASVCPTLLPLADKFRTADWIQFERELQFSGLLELQAFKAFASA